VNKPFGRNPERRGESKTTLLTTREVADIFNVHPSTIRRWCSQGKIKSFRTGTGGKWQFKREDVAVAFLEKSIRAYLKTLTGRS
jgi:excisionase family DNA binding protein